VDSQTFIVDHQSNRHVLKQQPSKDDFHDLRQKYQQENATTDFVEYGDVYFSMNAGDYQEPIVEAVVPSCRLQQLAINHLD
jgi:hypothetical protein